MSRNIGIAVQEVPVSAAAPLPVTMAGSGSGSLPAGTNNIGDVDIASIDAGETHIGEVGGRMNSASPSFSRPADTTAYAAKDAVSDSTSSPTVLSFDLARVAAGSGYIVRALLITNQSTCTARFRLHLFRTSPTAINDNSPQTLLWANRTASASYIDFSACATEGTGSDCAQSLNDTVRLPVIFAGGSTTIYGLLETLDAFTPASGQSFTIKLNADVN